MEHQKTPCRECPFKRDSAKGWLGGFSPEDTRQEALAEHGFDCHLTRSSTNPKQCAGALLFATRVCKSFRDKDLEKARKALSSKEALESVLGFDFVEYHSSLKPDK